MLPNRYRFQSDKDFQRVYKNGYKVRGEFGMLIGLKDSSPTPRFGYVVSKKVGNAVIRHKVTRWLRHLSFELTKDILKDKQILFQYISFKDPLEFLLIEEEYTKQIKQILEKVK